MLVKLIAPVLALTRFTLAAPSDHYPSQLPGDGFPNPDVAQTRQIALKADGLLASGPLPSKLSNTTLQAFQAIAVNEQWEVAYFNALLHNITHYVEGYGSRDDESRGVREKIIRIILAQEEQHALTARIILEHFKATVPDPCKYSFKVDNIKAAFEFAETFTALVLGGLQDAIQGAAATGDAEVARSISSVVGEEGEQNGFYRFLLGAVPAEKPFLTTNLGVYLYSWLNNVAIILGSCPYDVYGLGIPILPQLYAQGTATGLSLEPKNQTVKFSADLSKSSAAKPYYGGDGKGLTLTYLNGASSPISQNITNVSWKDGTIYFEAFFPFEEYTLFGLSIAALTVGQDFNVGNIVGATLAAPAPIQVTDYV